MILSCFGRLKVQKQPVDESENERVLRWQEGGIEQNPPLTPEEELQLAHLIARRNAEKVNYAPISIANKSKATDISSQTCSSGNAQKTLD